MNIKNIIFPQIEGLEKKWWHRLANVLICMSTIIILAISSISLCQDQHAYPVISYDFEHNYNQAKGREVICENLPYLSNQDMWHCGDYVVDVSDIALRYKESFYSNNSNTILDSSKGYTLEELKAMGAVELKSTAIKLKAKIADNAVIVIFKNIGYLILITFGWFVLWESIIYRVFLYIVYGNKKKVN